MQNNNNNNSSSNNDPRYSNRDPQRGYSSGAVPSASSAKSQFDEYRESLSALYLAPTKETHETVPKEQLKKYQEAYKALPDVGKYLHNEYMTQLQESRYEEAFITLKMIKGLKKVLNVNPSSEDGTGNGVDFDIDGAINSLRIKHHIDDKVIRDKLSAKSSSSSCPMTLKSDKAKELFSCDKPAGINQICSEPNSFPQYKGMQVCCAPFSPDLLAHIVKLTECIDKLSPQHRNDFRMKHAYFTEKIEKPKTLPEHMHSIFLHKYLPDMVWRVFEENETIFGGDFLSKKKNSSTSKNIIKTATPQPNPAATPPSKLKTNHIRALSMALPLNAKKTHAHTQSIALSSNQKNAIKQNINANKTPSITSSVTAPPSNPIIEVHDEYDNGLPRFHFFTYLVSTALYVQWIRLFTIMILEVNEFYPDIFQNLKESSPLSKDKMISELDLTIKLVRAVVFYINTGLHLQLNDSTVFDVEILYISRARTKEFNVLQDTIRKLCQNASFQWNVVHKLVSKEVEYFDAMELVERKTYSRFVLKNILQDIPNKEVQQQVALFITKMTMIAINKLEPSWNLNNAMRVRILRLLDRLNMSAEGIINEPIITNSSRKGKKDEDDIDILKINLEDLKNKARQPSVATKPSVVTPPLLALSPDLSEMKASIELLAQNVTSLTTNVDTKLNNISEQVKKLESDDNDDDLSDDEKVPVQPTQHQ